MEIKAISVKKLKPAPYNPRKIAPEALARLEASMSEFGLVEPLVVNKHDLDRNYTVIGGHQRLTLLKKRGIESVPCVILNLPPGKERALCIALNQPAMQGEFDFTLLADCLESIDDGATDVETLTGFTTSELAAIAEYVPTQEHQPEKGRVCPLCGRKQRSENHEFEKVRRL